jgi:DNA (cytosine-5)-methyltransferase 1
MRFLSVCSGIEAASVAWHPLGWCAAAFSEIEPFPCSLLAHHYPNVPNHGDMNKFKDWPDESVDLLVGGTPCQSFSIAGLRKGLADPRGNLMLTYGAIAARYCPEWLVWENVPGVLSSNGGRDFGAFLGMLAELGYGFAYRVLDAQYFGVAQRRRRVFVVANAGSWTRAAAVLFERESLSRHPAPRRETGKSFAGWPAECAGTLNAAFGEKLGLENQHINGGATHFVPVAWSIMPQNSGKDYKARQVEVAQPLMAGGPVGGNQGGDYIQTAQAVRRLTPRECERLQGFPDDYTLIPHRGKPAADVPRYKALGNSMAVPVMRWIGERIQHVNAILQAEAA